MNYCCRHCGSSLDNAVIDLGNQPPSNAYVYPQQLTTEEKTYPLKLYICTNCWLAQLPEHATADQLFTSDYAYFSSTSSTWCLHSKSLVEKAISKLKLNRDSFVTEIASNDGYLLQYIKKENIPYIGIEPTHQAANEARKKGINTLEEFFSSSLAKTLKKSDLIIANNVLAHVPDINDFMKGLSINLKQKGQISIEFPHLYSLIDGNQFDTIYHEHYSYLSLRTIERIAKCAELQIIDVEKLKTHGGSLRVWLAHDGVYKAHESVEAIKKEEENAKLESINTYQNFQAKANITKHQLVDYLNHCKINNIKVIGYGAAAKGNTLLNFANITKDLLPAIADKSISKQGKFMPGSHIPIISPSEFEALDPEVILLLPWNLLEEVKRQFPNKTIVTAIPYLKKHKPSIE